MMNDQSKHRMDKRQAAETAGTNPGGVDALVSLLDQADRQTERNILQRLRQQNPLLWAEVKKKHFAFEDLLGMRDAVLQRALAEVHHSTLAVALLGTAEDLRQKVFGNLSPRAAMRLKEDMEMLGPRPRTLVEEAQREVTKVLRRWRHVIL